MTSVFVLIITLLVNSVEPEVLAENCALCSSFLERQSEFLGVIFILIFFRFSLSGIKHAFVFFL